MPGHVVHCVIGIRRQQPLPRPWLCQSLHACTRVHAHDELGAFVAPDISGFMWILFVAAEYTGTASKLCLTQVAKVRRVHFAPCCELGPCRFRLATSNAAPPTSTSVANQPATTTRPIWSMCCSVSRSER